MSSSSAPYPTDLRDMVDRAIALLAIEEHGVIGIGVDVEEIVRWRAPDLRTDRVFAPVELAHAAAAGDPAERLAGTWCAKEAVVKALAIEALMSLRDVEIHRGPDGRPVARIASSVGIADERVLVSITHTPQHAVGIAALLAPKPTERAS